MAVITEQHRQLLDMGAEILTGPRLPLSTVEELTTENIICYSEPWRRQHVVEHMLDVFGHIIENIDDIEDPRATGWAALDHDIVYRPWLLEPGINEKLSGRRMAHRLAGYLPVREIRLGKFFIEETATHKTLSSHRGLLHMLDGDMRILGAPKPEFDAYDLRIRQEHPFVPPGFYYDVRGNILQGFYDEGEELFHTAAARKQYAAQTALNLGGILPAYRALAKRYS